MSKYSHKDCQFLVSSFVDPKSLKPAKSKEVQVFWRTQISFAKKILDKNPDMGFWSFLKGEAQKDKYLSSLLWFLSEKGMAFLENKKREYKTFLFDFPQPKKYLLEQDKLGESLEPPLRSKRKSIFDFLKHHGKKT